jgi:hypothetical protein
MNILPFIFAFLFVFSFFAFNFLKEKKSFVLTETVLDSHNRVESNLQNKIVSKAYAKLTAEPKPTNPTAKQTPKSFVSYRTLFPPMETSKFNLTPLIKDTTEFKLHPLYEPLANLFRVLYGKTLYKTENIEYRILDALLTKARKNPELENIADIDLDDPTIKNIFYKMLKGTNQYEVGKEGIPPLEDFLAIGEENTAISFSFASAALLEALFGEKITAHIFLEEEKKRKELNKYYYFSKEELQALATKNPAQFSNFSSIEPYINYSKKVKSRKEKGGKDDKTGLAIKKQKEK